MRAFASVLPWVVLAAQAVAQTPLGLPQTVNLAPIGGLEGNVSVASQPNGRALVVWCGQPLIAPASGAPYPGPAHYVLGRLQDGLGAPLGPVRILSTGAISPLARPEVAAHPDGGFVVVWDNVQGLNGMWVRRVGPDGLGFGVQTPVTFISASQRPVIEVARSGAFVVVWNTFVDATFARAFDASGVPLGPESQVNVLPFGGSSPALALLEQGGFVVAWSGHPGGPDPAPYDVFARLYGQDGLPTGEPFVVNTQTEGSQGQGSVAVLEEPNGGFLVTWSSGAPDPGTFGRHFDSSGAPLEAPFRILDYAVGSPTLLALEGGDRLLVWLGVFARRLGPNGLPAGPTIRVSPPDGQGHTNSSAAATPEGFTVAWHKAGLTATLLQSYTFAPRPRADFDRNGGADIVFRNATSGGVSVWLMNGLTRLEERLLAAAAPSEGAQLEGVADFDADGWPDLLWRDPVANRTELWLMEAFAVRKVVPLPDLNEPNPAAWHVVAVADFSADRRPDLLWRDESTGALSLWPMAGPVFAGEAAPLPLVDPQWVAAGAADFDGNGAADIAWHKPANGELLAWLLEAQFPEPTVGVLEERPFAPSVLPDTSWRPLAVADYDGDGRPDLLWQEGEVGTLMAWILDGLERTGTSFPTPSAPDDPAWQVVGPR